MNLETRSLTEPPEFRSEGGRIVAHGVAIRYGAKSKPIRGQFVEEIRSGAARKSVAEADILALHEHDPKMFLGRTSSGTLRLFDGTSELRYEIDLPDTTVGRDVANLLERRDVKGASFGFNAVPSSVKWSVMEDSGLALRSVGEMRLHHICTTCIPYYDDSSAELALRSFADERHMELRSVLEAAERGELPVLIASPPGEETEERHGGDGRLETTVIRPHIAALMF